MLRTYWWLLAAAASSAVLGTPQGSCNGVTSGCASRSLLQKEDKQTRLGSVSESADLAQAADSVFQMAQADGVAAQTHVISHLSREQNMQAQYLEKLAQQQVSVERKEAAYLERLEKRLAYQEKTIDALSKIALVTAQHTTSGQSPPAGGANGAAKHREDSEAVKLPQEQELVAAHPQQQQRRGDFEDAAPAEQQQQLLEEASPAPVAALQKAEASKASTAQMTDEEKRKMASQVSFFDLMTLRWSIR